MSRLYLLRVVLLHNVAMHALLVQYLPAALVSPRLEQLLGQLLHHFEVALLSGENRERQTGYLAEELLRASLLQDAQVDGGALDFAQESDDRLRVGALFQVDVRHVVCQGLIGKLLELVAGGSGGHLRRGASVLLLCFLEE